MSSENIVINNKVDLKKEKKKAHVKEYDKEEKERRYKIIAELVQQQRQYMIISCPCGIQFQKREQKRHERCKQHDDFLQIQNKSQ